MSTFNCIVINKRQLRLFIPTDNRNIRVMYEICSKWTIKTPEQRHWHFSHVFIDNFEQISRIVLVFSILTLHK